MPAPPIRGERNSVRSPSPCFRLPVAEPTDQRLSVLSDAYVPVKSPGALDFEFEASPPSDSFTLDDFTKRHSDGDSNCSCVDCSKVLSLRDILDEGRLKEPAGKAKPAANVDPVKKPIPAPRPNILRETTGSPLFNRTTCTQPEIPAKRTGHHRRTNARLLNRLDLDLAADGTPTRIRSPEGVCKLISKNDVSFPDLARAGEVSKADPEIAGNHGGDKESEQGMSGSELQGQEASKTPDRIAQASSSTACVTGGLNDSGKTVSRFKEHLHAEGDEDAVGFTFTPKGSFASVSSVDAGSDDLGVTALPDCTGLRPSPYFDISTDGSPANTSMARAESGGSIFPGLTVDGDATKQGPTVSKPKAAFSPANMTASVKKRLRNFSQDSLTLLGLKQKAAASCIAMANSSPANSSATTAVSPPATPAANPAVKPPTREQSSGPADYVHPSKSYIHTQAAASSNNRPIPPRSSSLNLHLPPSDTLFDPTKKMPITPTSIHPDSSLVSIICPPDTVNLNCLSSCWLPDFPSSPSTSASESSAKVAATQAPPAPSYPNADNRDTTTTDPPAPHPRSTPTRTRLQKANPLSAVCASLVTRAKTLESDKARLARANAALLASLQEVTREWHETYAHLNEERYKSFTLERALDACTGELERIRAAFEAEREARAEADGGIMVEGVVSVRSPTDTDTDSETGTRGGTGVQVDLEVEVESAAEGIESKRASGAGSWATEEVLYT